MIANFIEIGAMFPFFSGGSGRLHSSRSSLETGAMDPLGGSGRFLSWSYVKSVSWSEGGGIFFLGFFKVL